MALAYNPSPRDTEERDQKWKATLHYIVSVRPTRAKRYLVSKVQKKERKGEMEGKEGRQEEGPEGGRKEGRSSVTPYLETQPLEKQLWKERG